ncbi:MAG TPA: hypothetical protein VJ924_07775 [Alphaproteobacteria bacterium]|nr:hypothetical protein [Alphaproteobacteria bacterium]
MRSLVMAAMALALAVAGSPAAAGEADVIAVKITARSADLYDFDVTIRSNDRGWDYYADAFEVLTLDGRLLGRRELLHPHQDEQPFTRELGGVRIPASETRVLVRARHKPAGYAGTARIVPVPH